MQEAARPKGMRTQILPLILGVVCLPALFQGALDPPRFKAASAQADATPRTITTSHVTVKPQKSSASATTKGLRVDYAKLPLSFEPNLGQTHSSVKFVAHGTGYRLFLTDDGAVLDVQKTAAPSQRSGLLSEAPGTSPTRADLQIGATGSGSRRKFGARTGRSRTHFGEPAAGAVLRLKLVGANLGATITGVDALPGKTNYFIGNDPKQWRENIPTFSQVRYENVYTGIDLVYHGNQDGRLEYDFIVAPGADVGLIAMDVGGVRQPTAEPRRVTLRISSNGDLIIPSGDGELVFRKPVVYQEQSGFAASGADDSIQNSQFILHHSAHQPSRFIHRESIDGRFVLDARNRVRFSLGAYDHNRPVVIDPVLAYSTYLGGNNNDFGRAIAVDSSGNAYVTGETASSNFPTLNPYQAQKVSGTNAFVTKMNPTGTALIYSTYLGGNTLDYGLGIAVDSSGNVYVTGQTDSTNFPTVHAIQTSLAGEQNAFVTELSSTGSGLIYSTYLGGGGTDSKDDVIGDAGTSIAVDSQGNAFVAGYTPSSQFPTASPLQPSLAGSLNAFVTKLNWNGSNLSLAYSTYLGGNGSDYAFGIARDSANNVYVAGRTASSNFPLVNPLQTHFNGYITAFVAKLNSTGSALVYSTYLGGSIFDQANAVAVDSAGNAYLTGVTDSTNFPVVNPIQSSFGGAATQAFVAKVNAAGSALVYSSYLGGNTTYPGGGAYNDGQGIAVDSFGNAYVTGYTEATNFPTVSPLQASLPGKTAAFLAEVNSACPALAYSTYLGGSSYDQATAITVDSAGSAYLTGSIASTNFPTTAGAFQTSLPGLSSAFVAKISNSAPFACITPASLAFGNQSAGTSSGVQSATLTNTGNAALNLASITISSNFTLAATPTSCPYAGGSLAINASCTVDVSFTPAVAGTLSGSVTINDNSPGAPQSIGLGGTGTVQVQPSVTALNFGNQVVNTTSGPRTETFTNVTPNPLMGIVVAASGPFAQTNNCGGTLAPLASCNIAITFSPTTLGMQTGTVALAYLATSSTISLTGTGVGTPLSSCPTFSAGLRQLPLSFEANAGQTDPQVKFLSRGRGYGLFLTGDGAVLGVQKVDDGRREAVGRVPQRAGSLQTGLKPVTTADSTDFLLRMRLLGADPHAAVTGADELPGKANYFVGNDPAKWIRNAPTFAKVRYRQVYPGIDLVYYGTRGGELEYDFVVAPGVDAGAITLDIGAKVAGALARTQSTAPRIIDSGDLVISTVGGELRLRRPTVYQEAIQDSKFTIPNDRSRPSQITGRKSIAGSFLLDAENHVRFALGPYDHSLPLVIDPTLVYSTYLGGSGFDNANAIALDSSCNAYLTGFTSSLDFPTTSEQAQTSLEAPGATNAFISKLDSTGSALIYSTYLGGGGQDYSNAIAVDSSGNAYITGYTNSANFPTVNPLQPTLNGSIAAFISKLNSTGSALIYSTFLGGTSADYGNGIAVDSSGDAYITGLTTSADFPTLNAIQSHLGGAGAGNVFVAELNSSGQALVYSTYLGGSSYYDAGNAIAIDSSGYAYIAGRANSANFPTANPIQAHLAGKSNAIVAKLGPGPSPTLIYSTYLGGNETGDLEQAYGIALDSSGNAYVSGQTDSANFPTHPTNQNFKATGGATNTTGLAGTANSFAAKLSWNAAISTLSLSYSTYLGGNKSDTGDSIAVDGSGNAYVTGETNSTNFPTFNAIQAYLGDTDATNAFVTKLNSTGSALLYSTYLGGSGTDNGTGIALDSAGNAYVAGWTSSADFPTTDYAFQTNLGGSGATNAFVAEIVASALEPGVSLSATSLTFPSQPENSTSSIQSVTLTNTGWAPLTITSIAAGGDFALAATPTSCPYPGGVVMPVGANCTIDVTFTPTALGTRTGSVTISDNAGGSPQSISLAGTGAPPIVLDTVPNVVGLAQAAATTAITGAGLTVGIVSMAISTTVAGDVISQNPAPGASVNAGTAVNLVVSTGPPPTASSNEAITVVDRDTVTPLINAGAPVAEFSLGPTIGFNGQGGSQTVAVSDIGLAPLTLTSTMITGTGSAQFTAALASCSNQAASLPTTLPSGGACTFTVSYAPSANPADDTATLVFTDNASLSNLTPGGSNGTQSISLTGPGANSVTPGPPAATVTVPTVNEIITVHDQDTVTPLIDVPTPVVEFSSGPVIGFNGQGGSQVLTVSDIGLAPLILTSIMITGSASAPFTAALVSCSNQGTSLPTTLPSGGACTFTVTYTPSANPSGDLAALVFADNASLSNLTPGGSNGTQSITLSGPGASSTTPAPPAGTVIVPTVNEIITVHDQDTVTPLINVTAPVAMFSANALGFGGQTGSQQTLIVSSTGLAALTLDSATISAGSPFAVTQVTCSNGSTAATTTLPSGGACTLTITYTGATPATDQGMLVIADNAALSNLTSTTDGANFTQTVMLTGSGSSTAPPPAPSATVTVPADNEAITVSDQVSVTVMGAAVSLSPQSLSFTSQFALTTSAAQTVTLMNVGNAPLTISSISTSGDFSQTNTCGGTMSAGATCTIAVTFKPTAGGSRTGSLSISDSAGNGSQSASLSGTGEDFTIIPPPGSATTVTVSPGQPAIFALSSSGLGGLAGTVDFTCTGAPAESTCTVSPNPLTTSSTASTITVTVTTTAPSAAAPRSQPPAPVVPLSPGLRGFLILGLALAAMAWAVTRRNQPGINPWTGRRLLLAAGLLLVAVFTGCGSGGGNPRGPGTPAGSYQLTVTGTLDSGSSAVSHSVILTLNVN